MTVVVGWWWWLTVPAVAADLSVLGGVSSVPLVLNTTLSLGQDGRYPWPVPLGRARHCRKWTPPPSTANQSIRQLVFCSESTQILAGCEATASDAEVHARVCSPLDLWALQSKHGHALGWTVGPANATRFTNWTWHQSLIAFSRNQSFAREAQLDSLFMSSAGDLLLFPLYALGAYIELEAGVFYWSVLRCFYQESEGGSGGWRYCCARFNNNEVSVIPWAWEECLDLPPRFIDGGANSAGSCEGAVLSFCRRDYRWRTSSGTDQPPVTNVSFRCDLYCQWPCRSNLPASACTSPADAEPRLNCTDSPVLRARACAGDLLSDAGTPCRAGELALATRAPAVRGAEAGGANALGFCTPGQVSCGLAQCRCWSNEAGEPGCCAAHEFCHGHGRLCERGAWPGLAGAAPYHEPPAAVCVCDPGYVGERCEERVPPGTGCHLSARVRELRANVADLWPSASRSATATPSATPTRSLTPSGTPSVSLTPSGTRTRSLTPSVSRTPSGSRTATRTGSRTSSPSVTPSERPGLLLRSAARGWCLRPLDLVWALCPPELQAQKAWAVNWALGRVWYGAQRLLAPAEYWRQCLAYQYEREAGGAVRCEHGFGTNWTGDGAVAPDDRLQWRQDACGDDVLAPLGAASTLVRSSAGWSLEAAPGAAGGVTSHTLGYPCGGGRRALREPARLGEAARAGAAGWAALVLVEVPLGASVSVSPTPSVRDEPWVLRNHEGLCFWPQRLLWQQLPLFAACPPPPATRAQELQLAVHVHNGHVEWPAAGATVAGYQPLQLSLALSAAAAPCEPPAAATTANARWLATDYRDAWQAVFLEVTAGGHFRLAPGPCESQLLLGPAGFQRRSLCAEGDCLLTPTRPGEAPTRTPSRTASGSATPSGTASASPAASTSATATATPTPARSPTPSKSRGASDSGSASASRSASPARSASASVSRSASVSPTRTAVSASPSPRALPPELGAGPVNLVSSTVDFPGTEALAWVAGADVWATTYAAPGLDPRLQVAAEPRARHRWEPAELTPTGAGEGACLLWLRYLATGEYLACGRPDQPCYLVGAVTNATRWLLLPYGPPFSALSLARLASRAGRLYTLRPSDRYLDCLQTAGGGGGALWADRCPDQNTLDQAFYLLTANASQVSASASPTASGTPRSRSRTPSASPSASGSAPAPPAPPLPSDAIMGWPNRNVRDAGGLITLRGQEGCLYAEYARAGASTLPLRYLRTKAECYARPWRDLVFGRSERGHVLWPAVGEGEASGRQATDRTVAQSYGYCLTCASNPCALQSTVVLGPAAGYCGIVGDLLSGFYLASEAYSELSALVYLTDGLTLGLSQSVMSFFQFLNLDSCMPGVSMCEQLCDTQYPYVASNCRCRTGYTLVNAVACTDVNECFTADGTPRIPCPTQGFRCVNTVGSYYCVDIDECAVTPGLCPPPTYCLNGFGDYGCVWYDPNDPNGA